MNYSLLIYRFSFLLILSLLNIGCESNISAQQSSLVHLSLQEFGTEFNEPVDIQNAGDERLFIVERPGLIQLIDHDGIPLEIPFLDIQQIVESGGNEQGLLGLAFHPDYSNNGYFYVNYTKEGDSTVIARYSVSDNPNIADSYSEFKLLTIAQPFTNHNAGQLAFGPDGYLYIGTGDGGSGGDPGDRAQDKSVLLGKMLRIDVDQGTPYAIPEDNPFIDDTSARDEIWAIGLRNPWRYSFDAENGDLWIADVGQNEWEEINKVQGSGEAGSNYGWRCYEATHAFNMEDCSENQTDYVFPIREYPHSGEVFSCSVTGGYVYRGSVADVNGYYFYADFCSGQIHAIHVTSPGIYYDETVYTDESLNISTFGVDVHNELYLADLNSGKIYKLEVALGMDEESGNAISIYPVPAKEKLAIDGYQGTSDFTLELQDMNGRSILKKIIHAGALHEIDISGIKKGTYYVLLQNEDGLRIMKKVVIN